MRKMAYIWIIAICLTLAIAAFLLSKIRQEDTIVALNVSEQEASWKITNAGTTAVDVEVRNGLTGTVIRSLDIGKSKEIPKENVEITARQNG